ncbi:glycosyltransferase [Candidatus Uhrbacteria bacterium]|nr:glycosyltransferase [Candidatus Uhrbacteria bacterium]
MNSPRVAAIIPAWNEEETITQVVSTVARSSWIQEVIVISDGSTDATAHRARAAGATVYEMPTNIGKGEAMWFGLQKTNATVLVFLDADLRGLTSDHLEQLVHPVVSGSRAMNVGLRDRGRLLTSLSRHLPLISGERALWRLVMEQIHPTYLRGFMVEVALNYFCRSHRLSYGAVELVGLSIRRKYEKVGWPRAVLQYAQMAFQVAKAIVIVRVAHLRGKF